jgi:hypothetical protein
MKLIKSEINIYAPKLIISPPTFPVRAHLVFLVTSSLKLIMYASN